MVLHPNRNGSLEKIVYKFAELGSVVAAVLAGQCRPHATLMFALTLTATPLTHCGEYSQAITQGNEVGRLAHEKGSFIWKASQTLNKGLLLALTGKPQMLFK